MPRSWRSEIFDLWSAFRTKKSAIATASNEPQSGTYAMERHGRRPEDPSNHSQTTLPGVWSNSIPTINSREEAEKEIRERWIHRPIVAIVHYGSRVRGHSTKVSDWDFVVIVDAGLPIETRSTTNSGIDVIELDWRMTLQEQWKRRELCAVLMTQGLWNPADRRPNWVIDWGGVIIEKIRRFDITVRQYELYKHALTDQMKTKILRRIRRSAQRVDWMEKHKEIPSTPEIDALWVSWDEKDREKLIYSLNPEHDIVQDVIKTN